MPLPSIHRFYNEDYQGAPAWFQQFIGSLNLFADPMYQTLNKGLTFPLNFNAQVYSFTLRAGATSADNKALFTAGIAGKASGLQIVACNLASNIQAPIDGPVTLNSWYQDGTQIRITSISGLTDGQVYNITVLLF